MIVYANFGAMHPVQTLRLRELSKGIATLVDGQGGEITVTISEIRESRPETGSPIGYYFNKKDAY